MSADIIARCLARLSVLQSEALLISALKGGPSETVEQETVFSNREVTSMGFRKPLQVGRREAARPGGSGDMAHPGTCLSRSGAGGHLPYSSVAADCGTHAAADWLVSCLRAGMGDWLPARVLAARSFHTARA